MTHEQDSLFPELDPAPQEPVIEPDWAVIRADAAAGGRESSAMRTTVAATQSTPTERFKQDLGGGPYPETGSREPSRRPYGKTDKRKLSPNAGIDRDEARKVGQAEARQANQRTMFIPNVDLDTGTVTYSGEQIEAAKRQAAATFIKTALRSGDALPHIEARKSKKQ